jgi:hypothetical protein
LVRFSVDSSNFSTDVCDVFLGATPKKNKDDLESHRSLPLEDDEKNSEKKDG